MTHEAMSSLAISQHKKIVAEQSRQIQSMRAQLNEQEKLIKELTKVSPKTNDQLKKRLEQKEAKLVEQTALLNQIQSLSK